ncbi:hypothetical protein [Lentzea sp. NBRC 102530]|uniref:hypothetical protein n=1 Tax=Lentzea sp. NBRC 102530 TaxID=3032201 RepID=UPI0024A4F58C|nr:hypothetical protein [Lentzea sp. NBRC 102530]GLY49918.1 hypothetical protein Lesp01_35740 [Lentzea sp. NBRC 102530]
MSLVVVLTVLPSRPAAVTAAELGSHWAGAGWAVRMRTAALYKVRAALNLLPAVQAVAVVAAGSAPVW